MTEERKDRRCSDSECADRSVGSDRRDSPRLIMPFQIRTDEAQPFVDCEGDISLGGAFYMADAPPIPDLVDFRLRLPVIEDPDGAASFASKGPVELDCKASVVRSHREDSGRWNVHLTFRDMSLASEQALARFIDAHLLRKKAES